MSAADGGLESALDGLLTGIDQLLAQRPEASDGGSPGVSDLPAIRPHGSHSAEALERTGQSLQLLTALLHQRGLSAPLREATLSLIRRLTQARALPKPARLAWRGDALVSPRLLPWLHALAAQPGVQAWVSEEGEWVYVAQLRAQASHVDAAGHPVAWLRRLAEGFPVACLAEQVEPQAAQAPGSMDEDYFVLRLPRFPEFCRLGLIGGTWTADPLGRPAMVRWLDRPMEGLPDLLGIGWLSSETLDEDLRLPIPVVRVSPYLG